MREGRRLDTCGSSKSPLLSHIPGAENLKVDLIRHTQAQMGGIRLNGSAEHKGVDPLPGGQDGFVNQEGCRGDQTALTQAAPTTPARGTDEGGGEGAFPRGGNPRPLGHEGSQITTASMRTYRLEPASPPPALRCNRFSSDSLSAVGGIILRCVCRLLFPALRMSATAPPRENSQKACRKLPRRGNG
jgi:hypothetical protein